MRTQVEQRTLLKETNGFCPFFHSPPHFIPLQKKFPPMYPDKVEREVCTLLNSQADLTKNL